MDAMTLIIAGIVAASLGTVAGWVMRAIHDVRDDRYVVLRERLDTLEQRVDMRERRIDRMDAQVRQLRAING